jgi:hypothetical protein
MLSAEPCHVDVELATVLKPPRIARGLGDMAYGTQLGDGRAE